MIRKLRLMIFLAVMLLLVACGKDRDVLRLGIINPSINHLPLSYLLEDGGRQIEGLQPVYFNSGWEVQEALIAGQIDAAIMPFTYVYTAVAKDYPLRIISFLERESDALVSPVEISENQTLKNSKVGLLKASSVDLLMRAWARQESLAYEAVYFRSPNELTAALRVGEVQAIVAYVPIVQKLGEDYHALHWFGEHYPNHPCCDLAVNTRSLNPARKQLLKQVMQMLDDGIEILNTPELSRYIGVKYGLNPAQVEEALQHTKYRTGLDAEGRDFEHSLMQLAVEMGYLTQVPARENIYLELD